MMTFHLSRSMTRNVDVVEVWVDDKFIATICPHASAELVALAVISKYHDDVVVDHAMPPAVVVTFDLERT